MSSTSSSTTSSTRPRFDWYETDQYIVLNILVKNMSPERVSVVFGPRSIAFKYSELDGTTATELALALSSSIVPNESTYRVVSVKAEIKMKKVANYRWGKLEQDSQAESSQPQGQPIAPMASLQGDLTSKTNTAIHSHQSKMAKWEKQIKELEKEEEENNGVDDLFKKIYSTSSEEVRMAMNKSFQESNGTVLSTNWDEVKESKVECKPPDSSEFKKW